MYIEAGAVCAEEGVWGMACTDGCGDSRLVSCGCGGRHPVTVEEVIVIGWMHAGDSKLAEKTGGWTFCREEVVFVGGGALSEDADG